MRVAIPKFTEKAERFAYLRKNVNQILDSVPFKNILQTNNLQILNFSEPKQTQTTQRWKIQLKSSTSTMPLHTKIEFSRRKFSGDIHFEAVSPQILKQYSLMPIMANHYSIESMYEQKILALALRGETQSRDIFDLYFLLASGNNFKLCDKKVIENLALAKRNAMGIKFQDFKGQVISYLPVDYQVQYDDEFVWDNMKKSVVNSLAGQKNETN